MPGWLQSERRPATLRGMAYFKVLPNGTRVPNEATDRAFLLTDNWDDWFKSLFDYATR